MHRSGKCNRRFFESLLLIKLHVQPTPSPLDLLSTPLLHMSDCIPPPPPPEDDRPTWLLLGGTGFIGTALLQLLHAQQNYSTVTVVDLKPPGRCFLPPQVQAWFQDKTFEFIQADLCQDAHVDRIFAAGRRYDIVVDLMAETRVEKFSQDVLLAKTTKPTQNVITRLTQLCADTSLNGGAAPFLVEVSTAQVYEPSTTPQGEQGKIKPWTTIATAKAQTDEQMQKALATEGLRGVLLRPALVYGPGDIRSLMPRLCCSAVYQHEKEKMEFLWSKGLQINTLHITDMCRAIIWAADHQATTNGTILNLADQSNTTQGSLNTIIEALFGIKTDFAGTIMSNLAKLKLEQITNDSNEYHHPIWLALCKEHGIPNTPYTTYISQELLYNNALSVDGTAITKLHTTTAGKAAKTPAFTYQYPTLTPQAIYDSIKYAQEQKLWPQIPLTKP